MKKIVSLISLIVLLLSAPLAAYEEETVVGKAANSLQAEPVDVHLENYGVRYIWENGRQHSIGLYKIIIGDPLNLQMAMSLNKSNGFDGLIFTTLRDNQDDWHKIRVHRPVKEKRGWKKTTVVKKDWLPDPFNTMDQDLLNKVQFINVYPDNDGVAVVYINEGTAFADCEKIFHYISQKRKRLNLHLQNKPSSG